MRRITVTLFQLYAKDDFNGQTPGRFADQRRLCGGRPVCTPGRGRLHVYTGGKRLPFGRMRGQAIAACPPGPCVRRHPCPVLPGMIRGRAFGVCATLQSARHPAARTLDAARSPLRAGSTRG